MGKDFPEELWHSYAAYHHAQLSLAKRVKPKELKKIAVASMLIAQLPRQTVEKMKDLFKKILEEGRLGPLTIIGLNFCPCAPFLSNWINYLKPFDPSIFKMVEELEDLRRELERVKRSLSKIEGYIDELRAKYSRADERLESTLKELKTKYPSITLSERDLRILRLVGTLPPAPVEEDAEELVESLSERYE